MTTPRVAIVTGGSRGIGRAVATRLAADGMAVVIGYHGNVEAARSVASSIVTTGGLATTTAADVADKAAVTALFDLAEATYGGVDVVVNAAAVMHLSSIADLDLDELDLMFRTNVRGTFVIARQAARSLRRGGAIINFSSSVTRRALPSYAGYAATKAAVDAISLILAKELRGREITVNAVAPGATATHMFLTDRDPKTLTAAANLSPLERIGSPEEIADVVAFLAGPSRWINGQTLYANGGTV